MEDKPGALLQLNFRKIIYNGVPYDKQKINEAIEHLAGYLQKNIHSTSPFILLSAYNHIKTLVSYYAILKAGKIAAILDPGSRPIELTEIIEDLDPAAILFLNNNTLNFNYEEELVFRTQNSSFIIDSDLKDVCTIAYTNAEDGYSKGAMLTEKNLLTEIKAVIENNKLNQSSVMLSLLPFNHLFGLVQGILLSTHIGGTAIITELNVLKMSEIIENIYNYQVTHVYSVPSVYYLMGKHPMADQQLKNVKMFVSGGTKLTPFVFDSFFRNTHHKIYEGYGLTESSPACTFNKADEEPKVESVGKPIAGSDIRILDNFNTECKLNEIGEICIKGDLVFSGYFNNRQATETTLINGWLHTGDYGKKDAEGFVYFCGLKKNMINVAGNNVYPKKLERMMKINKNVIDIRIKSEESVLQGQIVSAIIKLNDTSTASQQDYKKWCLDNINNAILPKIWYFD
jgi:long-chain acyl-CoA synthetase